LIVFLAAISACRRPAEPASPPDGAVRAADVAAAADVETPAPAADVAGADAVGPVADVAAAAALARPLPADLDRVAHLDRTGTLTPRQRDLLLRHGFFLAPQPSPPDDVPGADPSVVRSARRATHLFHVYERNDYIRMPSYVTVDTAIDATHAWFDALLRDVEQRHLVSRVREGLAGLLAEAERVRAAAGPAVRAAAARAVAYWGTALRLLDVPAEGDEPERETIESAGPDEEDLSEDERIVQAAYAAERAAANRPPEPAPIPASSAARVNDAVARVHAAAGVEPIDWLPVPTDLTQMKPRGHYARNGVLQRYFRCLSWLGLVRFPVTGEDADPAGVAVLARAWLGAPEAAAKLRDAVGITTFFAGGPDAADIDAAARLLAETIPGAAAAEADDLLAEEPLARYAAALAALPPPRIATPATGRPEPQIRVAGRRAFEDAVALQELVPIAWESMEADPAGGTLLRLMGAAGVAAVLGSDDARGLLAAAVPAAGSAELLAAVGRARSALAETPAARWTQDAYHGTLDALRLLLGPPHAAGGAILHGPGWSRRALQAFAAGWAELRHDTILYGEQLGAECDAEPPEPIPGWVEPLPEVYARLAAMVRALDARLVAAGIPTDVRDEENFDYRPPAEKAEILLGILGFLQETAEIELRGEPIDPERADRISTFGGDLEWLLIALADTVLLSERDGNMAVVADVFTFRGEVGGGGRVVEVGVAHPDLVYALIPDGDGWALARGAVMSYREFLVPDDRRMTDEAWRDRLSKGDAPPRPPWLEDVYAEPVPAVLLPEGAEGAFRCGPSSGTGFEI
jgi:hypothetical protein